MTAIEDVHDKRSYHPTAQEQANIQVVNGFFSVGGRDQLVGIP
jgi:hypothetical protein